MLRQYNGFAKKYVHNKSEISNLNSKCIKQAYGVDSICGNATLQFPAISPCPEDSFQYLCPVSQSASLPLGRAHNFEKMTLTHYRLFARHALGTRLRIWTEGRGYPGLRRRRTGSCACVSPASRSSVSHRGALTLKLRKVGESCGIQVQPPDKRKHQWKWERRTPKKEWSLNGNIWLDSCVNATVKI